MHLVWLRNDLRLLDNPALYYASRARQGVIVAVAITPEQWQQHGDAPIKQDLYRRSLIELEKQLNALNIPLRLLPCQSFAHLPQALLTLAQQYRCQQLHFNHSYEWNERQCEQALQQQAHEQGLHCQGHHGQVLFAPGSLLTGQGEYYSVFTPFKRKAWPLLQDSSLLPLPAPLGQPQSPCASDPVLPWQEEADYRTDLWPAGEVAAWQRLQRFANRTLLAYDRQRDFPDIAGTSVLSPYLTLGILSPRQCLQAALAAALNGNKGAETWINELLWREFYKHVLFGFPRVSKGRAFKVETESLPWRQHQQDLQRWQTGQTGYPLVDAAMRQLNQTGWMHNRLRMVSAMFLSKHLLLDWRLGEAYFMSKLVDGDLAANNGGWQWSASTGTDAAPYFRIFNPVSQSQRFDAKGDFIKRFIPELSSLQGKALHAPWQFQHNLNYPAPMVDHTFARNRVLAAFKDKAPLS